MFRARALAVLAAIAALASGCGGQSPLEPAAALRPAFAPSPLPPALISFDRATGRLVYWPLAPRGGRHPTALSPDLGIRTGFAAAAFGSTVALANQRPAQVVLYDTATQAVRRLPDPFGTPVDLAVDRSRNVYALNLVNRTGNVAIYPAKNRERPFAVTCARIGMVNSVAVDAQGNIYVNGYPRHARPGVVEIPNPMSAGPQGCTMLPLRPERGYVAGLAFDPKTGDLIVLDNPDECAGGIEGRMTIYPRPYGKGGATVRQLRATCAAGLRLDADSATAFFGDSTVSGGVGFVAQRTYPQGAGRATYRGGSPAGFTTIPNALPNGER